MKEIFVSGLFPILLNMDCRCECLWTNVMWKAIFCNSARSIIRVKVFDDFTTRCEVVDTVIIFCFIDKNHRHIQRWTTDLINAFYEFTFLIKSMKVQLHTESWFYNWNKGALILFLYNVNMNIFCFQLFVFPGYIYSQIKWNICTQQLRNKISMDSLWIDSLWC